MKNSGFKMKGYTYPGTSPMKGKAQMKRDAARGRADDAQDAMGEAFDNQFKPETKSLTPMVKKSPAKVAGAVVETLKTIGTEALKAGATTAASAGVNALMKDKSNDRRATNTPTMNQNFGSTSIA